MTYAPKVGDRVRLSPKGLAKIGLHSPDQVQAHLIGFIVTDVDDTLGNFPGEFSAIDVDGPLSHLLLMDEDVEPFPAP